MRLRSSMSILLILALAAALGIAFTGCAGQGGKTAKQSDEELVIYSGRKEKYVKPVIEKFEKKTGIKVVFHAGDASQLANQIIEERKNPRADIYISNDAGALGFLSNKKQLQSYESQTTKKVPENLKANDNTWVGASIRSRVIMYNKLLVKEGDVPKSVFDLTDAKWKGNFAIAGSSNESMVSHITALRILKGNKFTEDFLKKLLANDPVVTKGHTDIRRAVGAGELEIGLVNHYYYHKELDEGSNVGVVYPDQEDGDIGTVLNVAGLGLVKGAKNKEPAQKFIDFVLGEEAQEVFAGTNKELPVLSSVPSVGVLPLTDYKQADVNLGDLGKQLDKTLDLIEKVKMP